MQPLARGFAGLALATAMMFSAAVLPNRAGSQELQPLGDLDPKRVEQSYPLVRCAGFHLANIEWTGETRLGGDTVARTKAEIETFMQAAAWVRIGATGDDPEWTSQIVLRDTSTIADLYLERYKKNYANSGAAWDGDPLWERDLKYCSSLLKPMQTQQSPQ